MNPPLGGKLLTELPLWYTFSKKELELKPGEAVFFVKERIKKFLKGEKWLLTKPHYLGEDEWQKKIIEEIAGHILLRISVSDDPRLLSWFLEMEGDLFDYRFERGSLLEKISIMKSLFGEKNVDLLSSLEVKFRQNVSEKFSLVRPKFTYRWKTQKKEELPRSLSEFVGIHFTEVSEVVGKKRALLYNGFAIGPLFVFRISVKRAFEKKLLSKLEELKQKEIDDFHLLKVIKTIKTDLKKIIHKPTEGTEKVPVGHELYHRTDLFPLCMRDLYGILLNKGHLSHEERLQLGLFLKKLGMSLEQQTKFWYENSVDNIGLNFEEFKNRVGYLIRHMYGLEGSKTDYNCPKCSTIIRSYYCSFAKKSVAELEKIVKKEIPQENVEKDFDVQFNALKESIVWKKPRQACKTFFNLKYDVQIKAIHHPIAYVRKALKITKKKPSHEKKGNLVNA